MGGGGGVLFWNESLYSKIPCVKVAGDDGPCPAVTAVWPVPAGRPSPPARQNPVLPLVAVARDRRIYTVRMWRTCTPRPPAPLRPRLIKSQLQHPVKSGHSPVVNICPEPPFSHTHTRKREQDQPYSRTPL